MKTGTISRGNVKLIKITLHPILGKLTYLSVGQIVGRRVLFIEMFPSVTSSKHGLVEKDF
jgi:hypothetical protein